MALTDPKDTLAHHAARALTSHRDMGTTPCNLVAKQIAKFSDTASTSDTFSKPETQAMWFYGMNHGMSLIGARFAPLEPLPSWEGIFVETYHREMVPRAVRAFYYLLLICIREARHNGSITGGNAVMEQKFGTAATHFFKGIKGGEHTIHQKFLSNPPACDIGTFTGALQWQFYNCSWSPGYGGPAWGAIADCLHRFVTGEYTAEMMLDTIWTLSHNNGPIFNKGLFYSMYDTSSTLRVLDIQRSGQIPAAVLYDQSLQSYVDHGLRQQMLSIEKHFPGEVGKYVDWFVVKALGGLGHYITEQQQQVAKHGQSPIAKEMAEKAALAAKQKEEAAAKAALEHAKNWFTVMPGIEVKIAHRG